MVFRARGTEQFQGNLDPNASYRWKGTDEYITRNGDSIELYVDGAKRAVWDNTDSSAYQLYSAGGTLRYRFRTDTEPRLEMFGNKQRVVGNSGAGQLILQADNIGLGTNATGRTELTVGLTNNSGGTLSDGDVVILDTSADDSVTTTTTANSKNPFIVSQGAGNGSVVWVAVAGKVASVSADTAVISRGDTLVTSTTSAALTPDNTETDPSLIIGYALTAKGSGAGTVDVLILR